MFAGMSETGLLKRYSVWSHEAKYRHPQTCPEFARSPRVSSTIQIVRFTSPSPPALAPNAESINIQDCDVVLITHHQGSLSELIAKHRPGYNLRSADNNLLIIPRTKTDFLQGFHCDVLYYIRVQYTTTTSVVNLLQTAPQTHCTMGIRFSQ